MLHKDTKNRIDDARDTLVGVLPLPSDQIELITIALIYKFMDDQDEELRQVGLNEKFFVNELKEYSWQQLMSNQLSAEQRVNKFINGIEAIQKAKTVPNLFKEIFQNAFLKFRDGKVLQRFLDVINGFVYDHSEELGNAFEYLLMTMGAQGDNGQFRTPRNIIDFITEVVDPCKDDTILDPACGTGGFLVSAFKHILRKSTKGFEDYRISLKNYEISGVPINWGDKLSSTERSGIENNIAGYDNTPLMVRLARVNLYLHHFGNPKIHEYNTLISDARWRDKYDCILANPPFMTPKGGIDPHDKFRLPANRTEILFSSYILQHLTPNGKAGFVVPEGIIFQTSTDYTKLRNWLIYEAGLWAVVSLPSNVFQPYSGVKTSILFIDKEVARKRNEVVIVKIENDGFSLNTNRNPIKDNDLPQALEWMGLCKSDLEKFKANLLEDDNQFIKKIKLIHRDDFAKLDPYRSSTTAYAYCKKLYEKSLKALTDLANYKTTTTSKKSQIELSKTAILNIDERKNKLLKEFEKKTGSPVIQSSEKDFKLWYDRNLKEKVIEYGAFLRNEKLLPKDIAELLDSNRDYALSFEKFIKDVTDTNLEIEFVKLADVTNVFDDGDWIEREDQSEKGIRLIQTGNIGLGKFKEKSSEKARFISEDTFKRLNCTEVLVNDVLISRLPEPVGRACIVPPLKDKLITSVDCTIIRFDETKMLPKFFVAITYSDIYYKKIYEKVTGASRDRISKKNLGSIDIPCPSLIQQRLVVAECDQYFKIIDACDSLIKNYAPSFKIDQTWDDARMTDIAKFVRGPFGGSLKKEIFVEDGYLVYEQSHPIQNDFSLGRYYVTETKFKEMERFEVLPDDILMSCSGTFGKVALVPQNAKKGIINQALLKITPNPELIKPIFLKLLMESPNFQSQLLKGVSGVAVKNVASVDEIKAVEIKVPSLEIQEQLIAEYEKEMRVLEGCKILKLKLEDEVRSVINKVWGK